MICTQTKHKEKMNSKLENFLRRNCACADDIDRLENLGAETLEQAWEKAAPEDLV